MRSKSSLWFECKISYTKAQDDGSEKKVNEMYVVDALSFTEAEASILTEMSSYISGAFEVKDIKKAAFHEVFFSDSSVADRYFKVKLQFITLDEKTEKEKRSNVIYLLHAGSIKETVNSIEEIMRDSMIDYSILGITETLIMDVFEHNASIKEKKI